VLVPIGGGGLAAGVSAAIKQSKPSVKVIGVEPAGAAAMKASVDAGQPVTLPKTASVADGLMPVRPGDITYAHVSRFVDAVITVEDPAIVDAVFWIFSNAKMVAEPSGAATTGAVLSGALDAAINIGGPVVAIVSGGNMAPERLAELAATR
jgi:threonine dehydratase